MQLEDLPDIPAEIKALTEQRKKWPPTPDEIYESENFALFVRESLMIEGIVRDPTPEETEVHAQLIAVPLLTVGALENFVNVVEPGAHLRTKVGENVWVGQTKCPEGGPEIREHLVSHINRLNQNPVSEMVFLHFQFLALHPFTDGNGRVSRAIWARIVGPQRLFARSFLHEWYYSTLGKFDDIMAKGLKRDDGVGEILRVLKKSGL